MFFYRLTVSLNIPSYALAIIMMTVLIKVALYPLTVKQMRSMSNMKAIQPEMDKIKNKYKNNENKEKMNKEVMDLYKKYNVNPAAGCLPLFIQMPILIGLFTALREFQFVNIEHAQFFWIDNLANPDPYIILPILVAVASFAQTKLSSPAAGGAGQNIVLTYFMPLFIGYVSIKFPAGLCLYWVFFNGLGVFQQMLINRHKEGVKPNEKLAN